MARFQDVKSKLAKTRVMLADPLLAQYIPETVAYSPAALEQMLETHEMVYVKPNRGRKGRRVVCISKDNATEYRIHYKFEITAPVTLANVLSFIDRLSRGKRFVIQQGIALLRVENDPIDFRVVVQKPYQAWIVTGLTAKIAAPGCAVTNYHQGGTLHDLDEVLIRVGYNEDEIARTEELFTRLGEQTAQVLNARYPNIRELGLDIGIDHAKRPWIFEVNTRPGFPRGNETIHHYHRIILEDTGLI